MPGTTRDTAAFCAMLPALISFHTLYSGHTHTRAHTQTPIRYTREGLRFHASAIPVHTHHRSTSRKIPQLVEIAVIKRPSAAYCHGLGSIYVCLCVPGLPLSSSLHSIYNQHPVSCVA